MNQLNYEIDWASVSTPELLGIGIEEGTTPQQLYHVSDELLGKYYQGAVEFLHEKDFHTAHDAFVFLTFLNPLYAEFWLGLGIADQSNKNYMEACLAYSAAEKLDPNNPSIHANLYQCYLELNELALAEESFQKCLEACGDDPQYDEIKSNLIQYQEYQRR